MWCVTGTQGLALVALLLVVGFLLGIAGMLYAVMAEDRETKH